MKNFDEMKLKIDALTVFGAVKSDPVVQNLRVLLECFDDSERGVYLLMRTFLFLHTAILWPPFIPMVQTFRHI